MIGKKAAIGIIAATGVVAVGVPVGIVVGQHASKTGSLDSKMQSKWSDIEKELASSFGGFDVRSKDVSSNREALEKDLQLVTDTKTVMENIIGLNSKTAYFNSFGSLKQNFDKYIENTKQSYQNIIDSYAQACLQVANGVITNITYNAQAPRYTIDVKATTNVTSGTLSEIIVHDPSVPNLKPFEIPFQVNTSIEDGRVKIKIDEASFHSFIFGNYGEKAFGKFDDLVKEIMKPNGLMLANQLASQFMDLLVPTNANSLNKPIASLRSIVTGEVANSQEPLKNSFQNAFGLIDFSKKYGDFTSAISDEMTKIGECNGNMLKNVQYLQYSLFGHHNEKLVNAAIKNLKDNQHIDFPELTQSGKPSDIEFKDSDNIFNSKSFVMTPADAKVVDGDFLTETPLKDETSITSSDFAASTKCIDKFNSENEDEYTFTNADRFAWLKEKGIIYDPLNYRFFTGEVLDNLTARYKEFKMNYQTVKEWFDTNEFSLVWNAQLFNSILTKYNISANDATFDINIENEDGSFYKLSILPNGQIYVKDSSIASVISPNPLFSKSILAEELSYYPLASSNWYTSDYNVAYSVNAKDVEHRVFEVNAPFVLNGNSKITFGITVVNREAGLTYTNANGRKPDAFAMNQKGELYVHTDGDRG